MPVKAPAVYILASRRNGTLYIGVTGDLLGRISEHKQHLTDGFATRYGVDQLVYFEDYESMAEAIAREKQLKRFRRAEKIALIERVNPTWRDVFWTRFGVIDPDKIKPLDW